MYPVPSLADLDVAYEQDFSDFTATTGQPVLRSHLPDGWKLDKENFPYRGDFESTTTTGGVYGNGALGIVQTGTAPNRELTATLYLRNNTGETIENLKIDYRGLVRRTDVNGNPEWDVFLNDVKIDELNYKTENLVDEDLSHIVTGLSIADGELITVRWETEREGTAAQKKIGFTNVEITPLSELPAVPNPVFSITAGTYFEDQTVFIDNFLDYEPTANIYYTLDGEDPTDADALYDHTDGILLEDGNGPITLKAIAIDGAEESGVTSAEYVFPENVDDIAAFRIGDNGTLYRITGEVVVLHRDDYRNRHFVRDATGSLTIWDEDDNITTGYSIGNGVENFIGIKAMKNSNGLVVLEAKTDPGAASDTGLDVTPVVVTLENLDLDYTGNLVTIENAEFIDEGTFTATPITNYPFTDPSISGTINFRTDFTGADYIGEAIPDGLVNLTA